jgi:hypothetical protein
MQFAKKLSLNLKFALLIARDPLYRLRVGAASTPTERRARAGASNERTAIIVGFDPF